MNKKLPLFAVLGLTLSIGLSFMTNKNAPLKADSSAQTLYYVDFFSNYAREDFVLSNGFKGKGNNLLYHSVQVEENAVVSKPTDPERKNYEFQGWFKETDCENEWNFTTDVVTSNTRLYAKWGFKEIEVEPEPAYTPPSTVLDNTDSRDYVINSIMNFKIEGGQVKVSSAAISKLNSSSDNVLPLMEYKVKANKTLTATYEGGLITVKLDNVQQEQIVVKNNSTEWTLTNTTYENKAANYEKNALVEDSYHVMLAGSSSMEFWETSKEDLDPIVSYNHGIGGTTIEQWDECLNARLVYPYKPKMVVYYVGINNVINSKEDATAISNRLKTFLNNTHAALPDTKIQYVMMNLIPGYTSYFGVINSVNAALEEYQTQNTWLKLINPGEDLLKANGVPNSAYFRTDGLHLSYYGYVIWGGIIKQSIMEGLENN